MQTGIAPGVEQGSHEELAGLGLVVLLPQVQRKFGHSPVSTGVSPHKTAKQIARAGRDQRRGLLQQSSNMSEPCHHCFMQC